MNKAYFLDFIYLLQLTREETRDIAAYQVVKDQSLQKTPISRCTSSAMGLGYKHCF